MTNTTEQKKISQKHRIQLDFSEEAFQTLQTLKKQINATTHAEVIRNALGLLKWVVKEVSDGNRVLVESKDEVRELVIPFIISEEN
jgi:hypothetical protein